MQKRIEWADALRGALILMIVYGHTASNGDLLKHYVYSFHVAAFFFLSGFLFSGGKDGFKAFFKKKFLSLMVPYYIFASVSILIFTFLGSFASDSLDVAIKHTEIYKNVLGMLYANAVEGYMKWNTPLWFLPCMFVTQILFYPLSGFVRKNIKRNKAFLLPIVLSAFILPYLDYFVFRVRALPFHLESSVFLLPFFVLGACLREADFKFVSPLPRRMALALILLLVGALPALFMNCRVNYFLSSYGKITVFYVSAFLSVTGVYMIFQRVSPRILSFIGKNTMPILLMHKFPIVFFQIALSPLFQKTGILHTLTAILISIASCAMCIAVGKVLEKFAPIMIGKRNKSNVL